MYGSMVDIQSPTAENSRGKKKKKEESNHSCKIECPHLLHRAAITSALQDLGRQNSERICFVFVR